MYHLLFYLPVPDPTPVLIRKRGYSARFANGISLSGVLLTIYTNC